MGANQDYEKPQRSGEELDLDRLQPWMQKQFPELKGLPKSRSSLVGPQTGPIDFNTKERLNSP